MDLKKLYKTLENGEVKTAIVEKGSQGEKEMLALGFLEEIPGKAEQPGKAESTAKAPLTK